MKARASSSLAALSVAAALAAAASPAMAQVRLDNWLYYQDNYGDTARWQYRAKLWFPFDLGGGYSFTQRIDLPFYYTNASGPDNSGGDWKFGASDLFIEEILDGPDVARNFRLRASLRLVTPTGGQSPFGSDQWQIAPMFGVNWRLPEHGVTIAPYARYSYGFDERHSGVTTKRSWNLFPEVTFTLAESWSLILYPEQGITYNQRSRKWFVPAEANVSKRLSKQWELSVGGAVPIVDDDQSYRWLVQTRLRYFFQ